MVLVDSSVWIDFFNAVDTAEVAFLETALWSGDVMSGDLIVAEVLQGFRTDREFETARRAFDATPIVTLGGHDLAVKAAANYRVLRAQRTTVRKTVDMFIGTYCIENHIELLHSDRDFDPMEEHLGLRVVRALQS